MRKNSISIQQPGDLFLVLYGLFWRFAGIIKGAGVYVAIDTGVGPVGGRLGCGLILKENIVGLMILHVTVAVVVLSNLLVRVLVLACTHALCRGSHLAIYRVVIIKAWLSLLTLLHIILLLAIVLHLWIDILRIWHIRTKRRTLRQPLMPIVHHHIFHWHILSKRAGNVWMFMRVRHVHFDMVDIRVVACIISVLIVMWPIFAHLHTLFMTHIAVVYWVGFSRLALLEL